jgi:hypothetical protein
MAKPPTPALLERGRLLLNIAAQYPYPEWRDKAACRSDSEAVALYNCDAAYGDYGQLAQQAFKQTYCAHCPVVAQCLAAGMREPNGIWGGMASTVRRPLRRMVSCE